jgi:hypothetical protein
MSAHKPASLLADEAKLDQHRAAGAPQQEVAYRLAVQLAAGAGSGVLNKTCIAPLERLKILYQIQGMNPEATPKYKGIGQSLALVVREEGFWALWKGNGANCVRIIPNYACKFTFNDLFKDMVRSPPPAGSNVKPPLTWSQMMAAGTMAGLAQTCITYPLELVRTRLSMGVDQASGIKYKGIIDCFRATIRHEGVPALYKGIVPTFLSGAPYTGLQMSTYEMFKRWLPKPEKGEKPNPVYSLIAGAGAGLVSQTITYPGDTVRRRMQTNGLNGNPRIYQNSWDCMMTIIRKEGTLALFNGARANVVRCIPGTAIQFWSYEAIKRFLGVEPIGA